MAADLGTTMDGIKECLTDALTDAGRGVCRDGHTVGAPVLGPSVCCKDCDSDGPGGQLSVTMQRMYPVVDVVSFQQSARPADCRHGPVAADLAFTLARCYPGLDNKGNPPTLEQLATFADGAEGDAQTMWNALMCCTGYRMLIRDVNFDADPLGGCSAVGVRVTVQVTPTTPVVVEP